MVTLMAIGSAGVYLTYQEAQSVYDTELSHVAGLMLSLLQAEDQEEAATRALHPGNVDNDEKVNPDVIELGTDFEKEGQHKHLERQLAFRIWKYDDLQFCSKKAYEFGPRRVTAGFSNPKIAGTHWRLFVLVDKKGGYTLEVAQEIKVRTLLVQRILAAIFSPLALLVPLILIVVWGGLYAGLKPLLAISEAVRRRSATDLTALPAFASLKEIAPLTDAINALLANLDYALKKERRFTDFAAHELRTPIAILKTQAQTALKSTDDNERKEILEAQVAAADRATDMVDQLLTLARLEHTDIPTENLCISKVAKSVVDERMPLAKKKHIKLHLDAEKNVLISGNKELLSITLSNLIDNALKYTPKKGEVFVTLSKEKGDAVVVIRDTGGGIPEAKLPYVTERFFRAGKHKQPGAGLGLTIVKRACELMKASLSIENHQKNSGLKVTLCFNETTLPSDITS